MNLEVSPLLQEERLELQALLDSGLLSRAPNLQHFLEYVCERYFVGELDGLKEYSIAVNALHRPSSFNPQLDTIVRVTAHALRKRLEQFYANEGADHEIHIVLPSGQYLPRFDHHSVGKAPVSLPPVLPFVAEAEPGSALLPEVLPFAPQALGVDGETAGSRKLFWGLLLAGCAAIALFALLSHLKNDSVANTAKVAVMRPAAVIAGGTAAIRFLPGDQRSAATDTAQQVWGADRYCTGGRTFSRRSHVIEGTQDNALFTGGREGKFQCRIPVAPGMYELHLFFADTAGERIATRQVVFYLNGGSAKTLDVVDEAGGDDVAMERVYTGVQPSTDGTVHLDFTADGSFVNALELVPSGSAAMLPYRMTAATGASRDSSGNMWLPERYYFAGRRSYHPDLPQVKNASLYQWERFGHFRYVIPVVPGQTYTVRLYFSENWFGAPNGSAGGAGSRIFDVFCNGSTLLRHFDISKQQKNGVVVQTFKKVEATAEGKLEISFVPVANYPLVNAVEVIQE